ncbi:MAG: PocR ligand-binding domain-containing protein [Bilifractor sp.]
MIATYDMVQLKGILQDFYTVTSIRITVFDDHMKEIAAYPDDVPGVCRILRSDPDCLQACHVCDAEALKTASGRHVAYTYRCHAGLTESIVPIYVSHILIGYLFFGNAMCGTDRQTMYDEILEKCSGYRIEKEKLQRECMKVPLFSENYMVSASNLMCAVAKYLAMNRIIQLKGQELPEQIDQYLASHFTDNITVEDICSHFKIGRSTLYTICRQSYGESPSRYIRRMRIQYAEDLLLQHPELSISEVSDQCGYEDYNYFITAFRKATGMSPGKYASAQQKEHQADV